MMVETPAFLSDIDWEKVLSLTFVLAIIPTLQIIWLISLQFFHPIILDEQKDKKQVRKRKGCRRPAFRICRYIWRGLRQFMGVPVLVKKGPHEWKDTKIRYRNMCEALHREFEEEQAKWDAIKKWLDIQEINVGQYVTKDKNCGDVEATDSDSDSQQDLLHPRDIRQVTRKDGQVVSMRSTGDEFREILQQVPSGNSKDGTKGETDWFRHCNLGIFWKCFFMRQDNATDMMKIINYHVQIMTWVAFFRQVNIGMTLSERTDPLRKHSMEWRGVVNELRKLEPGILLPEALKYSAIRKLSNNINANWDHSQKGTSLNPHSLLIQPWSSLEANTSAYLNSFKMDVLIYWFQILFASVVIQMIFK